MSFQTEMARMSVLSSRLFKHWGNTIAIYCGAGAIAGLYFTDWKVTNTKIPFYGKKFDDDGNL